MHSMPSALPGGDNSVRIAPADRAREGPHPFGDQRPSAASHRDGRALPRHP